MVQTPGVFKRGRVWWIRYSVGGQQVRETAKTRIKEQAVALLNKRQNEIFEGRFFPDRRSNELTMDGLQKMWLEAAAGKATLKHDKQRLARIVAHFKPSTLISTVTSESIDGFKAALAVTKTRLGEGMKPATINRHLAVLRAAFRLAERRGYKHRNPMAGVRFLDEDNERDRICSADEYEKLISAADAELRLAIVFGYWTAMRLGEIAGLEWKQVNVQAGMLRLARGDTKEAKAKQVPLASAIVDVLRDHPHRIDGRLFSSSSDALSARFGDLCDALKIGDLRFHDLRHTALTNMRRAGLDIMTMKQISGHRTLAMLERYNAFSEDDLRDAMARVEHRQGK